MPLHTPPDPTPIADLARHAAWLGLAIVGGVARYLDEAFRGGKGFKPMHLLMTAVVSGFCGYMTAQMALKVNASWAMIAAGIGGYLGTQAIDELRKILFMYLSRGVEHDQKLEHRAKDQEQKNPPKHRH